jgi:hypothetical protein
MATRGKEKLPMRAIPELSVDTQILERLLVGAAVGDVIGYGALSAAIGRDVQNSARHLLMSAQRRLQRERQMVFAPVVGVGIKRLDDAGIVGVGESIMARTGRSARRGIQKLACATYESLPNDLKVKHNAMLSAFGVLAHMTKSKTLRQLEGVAEKASQPLAIKPCLDELKQNL